MSNGPISDVVYFHTEPAEQGCSGEHRATIAAQLVGDTIFYGVSICSREDNFEKEVGRMIAKERLDSGFGYTKFQNGYFESFSNPYKALTSFCVRHGRAIEKDWAKYKQRIVSFKGMLNAGAE